MARSSSSIPSTISELFLYIYIYNCTFCTIGRYEKETHHLLDYINQKHTHTYKTDQHQQLHNIPIPMILFLRLKTKKSHFLHTMGLTVVLSGGGMYVQIVSEGDLSYLTIFKPRGKESRLLLCRCNNHRVWSTAMPPPYPPHLEWSAGLESPDCVSL